MITKCMVCETNAATEVMSTKTAVLYLCDNCLQTQVDIEGALNELHITANRLNELRKQFDVRNADDM